MITVNKPYKRRDRVGPQIHRKLNLLLARDVADISLLDVTITISSVDVSPDFAQAKVYFSLLDSINHVEVGTYLNKKSGLFQRELAADLSLRRMPRLIFVFDESILAASRIDALLEGVC